MGPLVFEPLLKRIRWGGRKLGTELHKPIGDESDWAESWEIADQPEGQSVVSRGPFAGRTLSQLTGDDRLSLFGRKTSHPRFPLLIKFLDANDWLSLQVHPNDEQAISYDPQGRGKTEAWVILDAEPDSQICAGLKAGVSREDFEYHLRNGTIEEALNFIPAEVGSCVFVPAGTVHALGPGILLAEIQQQSNITFRLHDWGRMGSDGNPREIHIRESLECIDFDRGPLTATLPVELSDGEHHFEELARCQYFVIRRHRAVDSYQLKLDDRFRILMCLEGTANLATDQGDAVLTRGTTVLLPAAISQAEFQPTGPSTVLEILQP